MMNFVVDFYPSSLRSITSNPMLSSIDPVAFSRLKKLSILSVTSRHHLRLKFLYSDLSGTSLTSVHVDLFANLTALTRLFGCIETEPFALIIFSAESSTPWYPSFQLVSFDLSDH
jgi:hypothetical protein